MACRFQDRNYLAFEVASVKPLADLSNPLFRVDQGSLHSRVGLTYLIAWAYGVPFQQVLAPEWARLAGMEIVAKASAPVGEDQVRPMLRTLLADRFQLRVHRESKETRVLAPMVEKAPRLRASESEGRWKRHFDAGSNPVWSFEVPMELKQAEGLLAFLTRDHFTTGTMEHLAAAPAATSSPFGVTLDEGDKTSARLKTQALYSTQEAAHLEGGAGEDQAAP